MYIRLSILSVIIIAGLCGLSWLGYHSVQIWAQGIEGKRIGEFAEVAEQIRQDVKRKLDGFIEQEQNRPYTDYQYYYVPDNVVAGQQQTAVLRSPLAGQLEHGLAYYNFQIQPDGSITTPNVLVEQQQDEVIPEEQRELFAKAALNRDNVKNNLLPILGNYVLDLPNPPAVIDSVGEESAQKNTGKGGKTKSDRTQSYPIESLSNVIEQAQVIRQSRELIASNKAQNFEPVSQMPALSQRQQGQGQQQASQQYQSEQVPQPDRQVAMPQQAEGFGSALDLRQDVQTQGSRADLVEIRIDPLVPVVVPGKNTGESIFGGQVFMLRRVKIEDKNFLQGFQLDEKNLLEEVEKSARRFIREDMNFELARNQSQASKKGALQPAYTAILDFGFGHLLLNLMEINPDRINTQIRHLQSWYFSIVAVVLLAVTLAVGGLWLNARAQIKLAQKKDDFVSAVSHELRTPLTSIRMYAEMLEKDWIKSEDKFAEYYKNMRQESERLGRLIENVLDISRIQKGQKKYVFTLGDINKCVEDVVAVMAPYAAQKGFLIKTELGRLGHTAFDGDAIKQIVVNLLDNAIKYSRDAEDKTITVRTKSNEKFVLIEVEDHGPGIPHRQQRKVFQEFYRIGAEATRETTGSGLGLALVKKFAQAHNGFVEVNSARPTGAIFRVALAHVTSG